jgi:hypothetical protein
MVAGPWASMPSISLKNGSFISRAILGPAIIALVKLIPCLIDFSAAGVLSTRQYRPSKRSE